MEDKVEINRNVVVDLIRLKEEFDSIVESIELMGNEEFMNSYTRAKKQIEKREFDEWDEL